MVGDRGSDPLEIHPEIAARLRILEEENRALRTDVERLEGNRRSLQRLSDRVLAIDAISQDLNSLDLDRITRVAVRQIPEVIGARTCSLFLYDYEKDELNLKSHTHPYELSASVPVSRHPNTVMSRALQSRKILNISRFEDFESSHHTRLERPFAQKYSTETCLSVPLRTANFTVGILNFAEKQGHPSFDDIHDMPAVEHLSRVLAMAIRNCNLFSEVQSQARTDDLTRLGNHRAFHETLRGEMHRATRYGRPLGLMMLDVDSFKEINDRFGHLAGDAALAQLGRIILSTVRREDLAARYGGDEIAILLPETSRAGCVTAVERLMAAVRGHAFTHEDRILPVTISVGLALFVPDFPASRLIAEADSALYRAKQSGRNRYALADA